MLLVSLFILVERPTGAYTPAAAVEVDLDSAKAYALFALSSVKNEQQYDPETVARVPVSAVVPAT